MKTKKTLSNLKIKLGSLVDSPAQEHAHVLMIKGAKGVSKEEIPEDELSSVMTDEVDGHSHELFIADDAVSGETELGGKDEESQHVHTFTVEEDGSITFDEADGHTHELAEVDVVADEDGAEDSELLDTVTETLAEAAATVASIIVDSPETTLTAKNRKAAAAAKTATKEQPKMSLAKAHAHALAKARLERDTALAYAKLTDVEKSHVAKLPAAERPTFIAKSREERATLIKATKDGDPIVYTTTAGMALRKSAGPLAISQAREIDELKKSNAINVSKARELELMKRVDEEMPNIAGENVVKAAILDAIDCGIEDEATKKAAYEIIKSCNGAFSMLSKSTGYRPSADSAPGVDARSDLRKHVTAFSVKKGIPYTVALNQLSASDKTTRDLLEKIADEDN